MKASNYVHRLHALNITNGAEEPYSPVVVAASVPGGGVASTNGVVCFDPEQQLQRPALTLAGGMLFVAFGSQADTDPYHGWVLGYDASHPPTGHQLRLQHHAPRHRRRFWRQCRRRRHLDGRKRIMRGCKYELVFLTGNGSFSANTNGGDYGDSFVRLSTTNGLAVADYFTPYYQAAWRRTTRISALAGRCCCPTPRAARLIPI